MKILKYRNIDKGCLKGSFDLQVDKYDGLQIIGMTHFEKEGRSWVTLPQESYMDCAEKKYKHINKFDDPAKEKLFKAAVECALEKYLGSQTPKITNIEQTCEKDFWAE